MGDFPPVPIATPLGTLRDHPDYAAAKGGDADAALRLVLDVLPDQAIEHLRQRLGDRKPTVVPVLSEEAAGRNKIPLAYALVIAHRLGLPLSTDIVQTVRAERTGEKTDHRLAFQPAFDGPVRAGQEYLIVDDAVTFGATLANLRGHIEANGGRVVQAAALTGYGETATLAVQPAMLRRLREKHGDELERFWRQEFGYGLDQLTQAEAGHLRKAESVDAIRDRIAAARERAGRRDDAESTEKPVKRDTAPPSESRGLDPDAARDHVDRLTRRWRTQLDIQVVNSAQDLPDDIKASAGESLRAVRGAFVPGSRRVYLVADRLSSLEQLERTLFHEALGHYGIRAMFGPQIDGFLRQVYKAYGRRGLRDIAERYGFDLTREADQLAAAEEKIARIAEDVHQGKATQIAQRWWDRFVEAARQVLRRAGFQVKFSPAEIRNAVREAGRSVREGRAGSPGTAATNVFRFDMGAPVFVDGFTVPADNLVDRIRQKLQDKYLDLKRAQEAVVDSGGTVPDSANAYMLEELYHGRAEKRIEEAREQLTIKPMLNAIRSAGLTIEEADAFLYARHAKERNAKIAENNPRFPDGGSGMTNAEADAILKRYANNPAVQRIGHLADAIVAEQRRLLVEEGLERPETVAEWAKAYQHYVPLTGESSEKSSWLPRGRGFDIRGRQKRAFGRKSKAGNIVAQLIAQYETTVVRAEKARVGRAFFEFVTANPNDALWEVDQVKYSPRINPHTGLVMYGPDPTYKLADNVLNVRLNGVDHHITLKGDRGKRLAVALKNLGAEDAGVVVRSLGTLNRYLSLINTGLNPEFVISNLVRDLQTAGINLAGTEAKDRTVHVLRDVPHAWRGIRAAMRNKGGGEWAEAYREFERVGGKTGWADAHNDIQRAQKALESELRRQARGEGHPLAVMRKVHDVIMEENTAVENAVRLAAYVHAKQLGLSPEKAASLAKNLTVNFNRKGALGTLLNSFYLFYNASIQGSARLVSALQYRPVQKMVGGIVIAAMMADILNRLLGDEDEAGRPYYDKIPDHVKERNFIIMKPGSSGEYFKIPLPYGYNVFHSLGREVGFGLSQAAGWTEDFEAGEAVMRIVDAVIGSFNPLGSDASLLQFVAPTILDPFVQTSENRNFAGQKVKPAQHPFDISPKPESQLYWNSTSELSKGIAGFLNAVTGGNEVRPGTIDVSPAVLDHFAEFVTGGAGQFLLNSVDLGAKLLEGEPIETRRVPFARKVMGEVGNRETLNEYMENLQQVEYAAGEVKAAVETGDREWRDRVRKKHGHFLRAQYLVKEAEKQLTRLRKQRRAIQESDRSAAEKRERIEKLDAQAEKIMLRVNGKIRELARDQGSGSNG